MNIDVSYPEGFWVAHATTEICPECSLYVPSHSTAAVVRCPRCQNEFRVLD